MGHETYFFTFGGGSPFRSLYVEVEIRNRQLGPEQPKNDYEAAHEAMASVFGMKWANAYTLKGFKDQPEKFGLKRLAKIIVNWPKHTTAEI